MVLEVLSGMSDPNGIILVIDMVIFTAQAIHSEIPVTIPWLDWGTQYTWCFPHHESFKISVFGSKMAYILPVHYVPEPGQRLEGFSTDADYFYVHIWDFNDRAIARAENACYRNSQRPLICRPGDIAQSALLADTLSDRPYIATVCRTPFKFDGFDILDLNLFLEQDRFTLTWVRLLVMNIAMSQMQHNCSPTNFAGQSICRLSVPYRQRLARTSWIRINFSVPSWRVLQ